MVAPETSVVPELSVALNKASYSVDVDVDADDVVEGSSYSTSLIQYLSKTALL